MFTHTFVQTTSHLVFTLNHVWDGIYWLRDEQCKWKLCSWGPNWNDELACRARSTSSWVFANIPCASIWEWNSLAVETEICTQTCWQFFIPISSLCCYFSLSFLAASKHVICVISLPLIINVLWNDRQILCGTSCHPIPFSWLYLAKYGSFTRSQFYFLCPSYCWLLAMNFGGNNNRDLKMSNGFCISSQLGHKMALICSILLITAHRS